MLQMHLLSTAWWFCHWHYDLEKKHILVKWAYADFRVKVFPQGYWHHRGLYRDWKSVQTFPGSHGFLIF